jgi:Zn-dependent metalloprotease
LLFHRQFSILPHISFLIPEFNQPFKSKQANMIRSLRTLTVVFCLFFSGAAFSNYTLTGFDAEKIVPESKSVMFGPFSQVPSFVVFNDGIGLTNENVFERMRNVLRITSNDQLQLKKTQKDEIGYTHYRYQQYFHGIKVEPGEYIVHVKDGYVKMMNGLYLENISVPFTASVSESAALQKAIDYIGATLYKWQVPSEENWFKLKNNDPNATLFPKGELVITAKNGDLASRDLRLTWKFDIYAHEPMSRHYVYVDATTGEIISQEDRICHVDVNGTANTRYSGTQTIVTDNYGPNQYRLQETGRGLGVRTFDLNNGTNYGNAVDFTDADNNWTTTTNMDDAATDAHWGAEMTYDYYVQLHNRNGLDDNGMQMDSYVHYGNSYNNAFWNGSEMTYGDGSNSPGGFTPLTAIDVCGHEFTHGVTSFTASLVYSYESGALNESFSDIFGTCIEFWKKPLTADYLIGEEIMYTQPGALRSMNNPNQYGDPDTYLGNSWYTGTADNGGVHTNSGVQNKWFYILSNGESGTNDNSQVYNVTGIGVLAAGDIAFRNLTTYLISSSQYADARTFAIQSAQDLYGACSPEVIATTNAWYAVGVGPIFNATVSAGFTANITTSCVVPFTVNFSNSSLNASNASWDFGDMTTDTAYNPSHTYTQGGTYTVQLTASGACGTATTTQTAYITINLPTAPTTTGALSCSPNSVTLNASGVGNLEWFTTSTGGLSINSGPTFTTPFLSATTTYYVEDQVPNAGGNTGAPTNAFGTGANHNSTTPQYLIFDVLQPCTLVSVFVYSSVAGTRNILMWDNAGNLLQTIPYNFANGNQTVTLNLPLTPGTGFRLGGVSMNLYRNNSGASYPYSFPGYVTLTSASAGPGYYYFYYDWVIAPEPCISPRTPVTAFIGGPTASLSPFNTVCVNWPSFVLTGGAPSGGTYSGPGVSSGNFDPNMAGPGTHIISYIYADSNGCTDTATQTIFVSECLSVNDLNSIASWSVYPNPSNGNLNIDMQMLNSNEVTFSVVNLVGQTIFTEKMNLSSGTNNLVWNIKDVSNGVYMIRVASAEGTLSKRIEIIK